MLYFCLQLHSNFWYAEYHHDQAIRQFTNLYHQILDVFEKHNGGAACWDFDTQLTLDILEAAGGNFFDRLNTLVVAKKHDVIPCTWATTLATHHTAEEFAWNFERTTTRMNKYFKRVAPSWTSQDGAFSPNFIPRLKKKGLEYLLLDARLLNRYYPGQYSLMQRFRPGIIEGSGEKLPVLWFGIEGLNSYGDYAGAFNRCKKMIEADQSARNFDHFIYPFIDTERILPEKLDRWLTQIEAEGAKYCPPSQFYTQNSNITQPTPFEFDVGDWHDWSFHNDIYADQRLWTYVERARDKIQEAWWWILQYLKLYPSNQSWIQSYEQSMVEAMQENILAQSSDKSHWYACQHKMDIGLRYSVAAYEKASFVVGILTRQLAGKLQGIPDRPQAMKDEDLNLTVINPFTPTLTYPAYYPLSCEFPYIVTVNINTSPAYVIEPFDKTYPAVRIPTLFHVLPGMSVHNYRTEVFYQHPVALKPRTTLPLRLIHSREEENVKEPSQSGLENDLLRVDLTPTGDIKEIIHKISGIHFKSIDENKDQALLSSNFECYMEGAKVKDIRTLTRDCDMSDSWTFSSQSTELDGQHRFRMIKNYRLFPRFPGLMVDAFTTIAGPVPGYYCPFELYWSNIRAYSRDVIGDILTTGRILRKPHQIFMNDWIIVQSQDHSIGLAVDKRLHSCKQLYFRPQSDKTNSDRISIGFIRHFPEWVAQNLLNGIFYQRLWIVPFPNRQITEDRINFMRTLSQSPILDWYL